MVGVLNGLTARRDALCLLIGCILTVLDEAPSGEERQQSLDGRIDVLKRHPVRSVRRTKDRLWHDPADVLAGTFAGRCRHVI
jgi:hypothetical protein